MTATRTLGRFIVLIDVLGTVAATVTLRVLYFYNWRFRYHGSYRNAWGGWAGDAFIDLTGGIAETIKTAETSGKQLFSRIKSDLATGAVIACTVPVSILNDYLVYYVRPLCLFSLF